jgi:DNA-binding transcriptional LysR family regulator
VDLDLAQVRAFAATADELHFGRAATRLFLSQQALSKRIARLEDELGVLLFVRGKHAVELTEAGQRFLEPARRLLADSDRAVAAARHTSRPLRLDLWGHLYGPMRTVGRVVEDMPGISTEIGLSRDLPATVTALLHGEIDVGFGRVYSLAEHSEDRLCSRLARLEPVDAVLSSDHRLAGRPEIRPADLRDSILWCPAALGRLDFLRHFAERFSIRAEEGGANLGLDYFIDRLGADPRRFALMPADVPLPDRADICSVPLSGPTPLYAWSLLWRRQDQHPSLDALLRRFAEIGRRLRWLHFDPGSDWLPDHDRAELRRQCLRPGGRVKGRSMP